MSRRARITPRQAGVPTFGDLRRVPGLRRAEVAQLAGVSTDYYTRLERGTTTSVSDSVLQAVATALKLDEAERAHLMDLARAANVTGRVPRHQSHRQVRPGIRRLLAGMSDVVAFVQNGRLDVLAVNTLGRALYAELFDGIDHASGLGPEGRLPNHARYIFLDPRAVDFYPDWGLVAATSVAMLRTEAGHELEDRALNELIGELTARSDMFARLWAAHDVQLHTAGTKHFHHPVAGDLSLQYETMELAADVGQWLITFTAEQGSASQEALSFLSSWVATVPRTAAHDRATENTL
jgi:transcriptional regulator with XRE-family HTH domain